MARTPSLAAGKPRASWSSYSVVKQRAREGGGKFERYQNKTGLSRILIFKMASKQRPRQPRRCRPIRSDISRSRCDPRGRTRRTSPASSAMALAPQLGALRRQRGVKLRIAGFSAHRVRRGRSIASREFDGQEQSRSRVLELIELQDSLQFHVQVENLAADRRVEFD